MNEQKSLSGIEAVGTETGELSIAEHTAPLDAIASGVHGLRTILVNQFAIEEPGGGWALVDTGIPGSTSKIREWAADLYPNTRPVAILLTHGHFDHTGAVLDLAREWKVPVYAHPVEFPYVTGQRAYMKPDTSVGGGVMSLLSPMFPREPVNLTGLVQPYPADGSVPGFPSWQWIHTPGHTEGHVSFFRKQDRVLIAGDALSTTKQESFWAVMRQKAELHGPPAYFTSDWNEAWRSVEELATLRPDVIVAGHGLPVTGSAATEGLAELARRFNEVAIPESHR